MSETTLLRSNAIISNASVGTSKPPMVSAGPALPKVQVKPLPPGAQVQAGQLKPVAVLPPRDEKAAVVTGGLPMVNVKMTRNGPQIDDGQEKAVVLMPPRNGMQSVAAGGLPMVQVQMTQAGPQVHTAPSVHAAPPHVPSAAPMLSAPRVTRVAAPRPAAQTQAQPLLTADQLLLCRHRVDKYLAELLAESASTEDSAAGDNVKLAEETILAIDRSIAILTAQAAEATAIDSPVVAAPTPVASPAVGGYRLPAAFAPAANAARPAPAVAYVAPRAGGTGMVTGPRPAAPAGARQQRHSAMAPRRVARGGMKLPPAIVKMVNGRPVVQNQDEIDEAIAAAEAAAAAAAAPPPQPAVIDAPPQAPAATDLTSGLPGGDAQG